MVYKKTTDGIFKVPFPTRSLAFTGERMTSAVEGQVEFEHFHRYCLARDLCQDLDVLDVASGEGYGSAILAEVALSVIGVEIDERAVEHSREAYPRENLRFLQGSAIDLPLEKASVDAVVSFETLEHIREHDRFMAEVRRVLRPGGLFFLSTPDRLVYSAQGEKPNPYHILELTEPELKSLLRDNFKNIVILRQRAVLGSLIATSESSGHWRSFERRDHYHIEASNGLARFPYLLGIASDSEFQRIDSSVYIDRHSVYSVVESFTYRRSTEERAEELLRERDAERERADELARERDRERERAEELLRERDAERERAEELLRERDAERERAEGLLRERDAERERADELACERDRERERASEFLNERGAARSALIDKERRAWKMALAAEHSGAALTPEHPRDDEAELNLQRAQLSYLDRERRFLAQELSKAYRRPWRPIKYFLSSQILTALGFTATPFSTSAASRFKRSARKRSSKRFEIPPVELRAKSISALPPKGELTSEDQLEIITFPSVDQPGVSIIVHVYKGLEDLEACLRSVSCFQHTGPSFEVILIDDCPSEPVLDNIPDSEGLTKIANRQTLGFPLSCNAGAAVARGRHLCFLGSNTIVSSGWLRALVEAAEETPRAAIVGPMLLNVDGSIQDAGWRMLADGSGQPIGRGGNPRDGAFTYRRLVDCVTRACFLVPARTFKELGGLDPSYGAGLDEEFDFSFRARALSLRTVYEPRSRVTYRGSTADGAKRRDEFSEANHAKFLIRFAETLRTQPSDAGDEFVLRQGIDQGDVILVVDAQVPRPDHHAGGLTIGLYLELLASAGWRVVFGPMYGSVDGSAAEALERRGIELIWGPVTIDRWLSEHGKHVQKVWLAGTEVAARYVGVARAYSKARVIYYTHDLHHIRMRREAELRDDPVLRREAAKMRLLELGVLLEADRICAPSELECEEIRKLTMGKSAYVLPPYFYEAGDLRPRGADHFSSRSDVVFVGGFPHLPNVDAALFIAREIMPLVWREVDRIRLVLVGYAPPKEVQALAGPRIVVTGYVPDIEPYMDQARVNLAALRFGAGVKGKVVEALRLGVPVVTTTCGAEGVGIELGRDAIVAEGPEALAQAVISLFRDADRCAELSAAGVELVKRRFSRALTLSAIETIFTDM